VEVGRNAELRCSPPLGVPSPKVYWLRNGSPLETAAAGAASVSADANPNEMSSATGFVQSADGHLLLGEAELRHQGNYSCVAENIAARRVSEPAVLTVYGEQFSFYCTNRRTDAVKEHSCAIIEKVNKIAKKTYGFTTIYSTKLKKNFSFVFYLKILFIMYVLKIYLIKLRN